MSERRPLVTYERDDHIALIRMRRPERHNALSNALMQDLAECWVRYRDDDDAWIAVFSGEGPSFSSGMDINERADTDRKYLAVAPEWPYNPWFEEHLDKPTIAAVQGYALGGGFFFASRCDLRVAGESAKFQVTEPLRGGLGGYELLLLENLPYAVAAELVTGAVLTARRAYEVGFVNRVVPDAELLDTAVGWARELCRLPPKALRYNMKLLRDIRNDVSRISHSRSREIAAMWQELHAMDDTREAFDAFLERREPRFTGR